MNSSARKAATDAPFLWGSLNTVSLADIFGVLALSRQLVRVRFTDEGRAVGAIAVKAGMVIGAEDMRTRARGADALKSLLSDPGTSFAVFKLPRTATESQATEVLGKLGELLPYIGSEGRTVEKAATPESDPEGALNPSAQGDTSDAEEAQAPEAISKPAGPSTALVEEPRIDTPQESSANAPTASHDDDVMLRGNVSEASFDEILEVLQLNEQHLLISFIRGDSKVGSLALKAENVLAVTAGGLSGKAAFSRLYRDHGDTFEVRRLKSIDETQILGSVPQLLADVREGRLAPFATASGTSQSERPLFIQGRLSDFPMGPLVGSLDLCRQPLELELRHEGKMLHRVHVKSGRITSAVSTLAEGVDGALASIRLDPGTEFLVYRSKEHVDAPPVAPLEALISESDMAPRSAEQQHNPSVGPVLTGVGSAPGEFIVGGDRLSKMDALLERVAADVSALQVAMKTPAREPRRTELAPATSDSAGTQADLLPGFEQVIESAIQEIRAVGATRSRRESALLLSILVLQLGCLAAGIVLLVLAM